MPSVADLIVRAVVRSLGPGRRAILLRLGREAQRRYLGESRTPLDPPPAAPTPLVRAVFVAWLCGLVAFALVVLNLRLFLPAGRTVAVFQLAVGAILLVEGLGLAVKRFPFRRLLSARLTPRSHRGDGRRRRAARPRLLGATLTVLGVVWVGAGVLNLLRGALELL